MKLGIGSPPQLAEPRLGGAAACSDRPLPTGGPVPAARTSDVIGSGIAYGALDYNLTSFDISTLTLSATPLAGSMENGT